MSNIKKYKLIFIENFNVDEDDLNDAFTYDSIPGWDSIAHVALVGAIEDSFDIMLDTEDILEFNSFKSGIAILEKYGIEWE